MALEEQRILKSVTIDHKNACLNVCHADQVLRDGEVIAETLHRRVYYSQDRAGLLLEVADGDKYADLMGWAEDA